MSAKVLGKKQVRIKNTKNEHWLAFMNTVVDYVIGY